MPYRTPSNTPRPRPVGRSRRRPARLRVETLDDRSLPSFATPITYAAGGDPQAVATADFNGDGRLDLVVANYSSNTVSVLMGNGNGTFQPASSYATGANPRSVAVGDFTGDGKPDVVTANEGGGGVSVLVGNGDGTFQPARDVATGGGAPQAAAVGDFNADGKLDLAVTGYTPGYGGGYYGYGGGWYSWGSGPTSEVTVLVGHGDGTFAAPAHYDLGGASAPSAAVGDFTGDGKADLVTGSGALFSGNGDGTFRVSSAWTGVSGHVVVADFNGDGRLDLAGEGVSVALGNGDGSFRPAWAGVSTGLRGVGDFNGDGKPDLATMSTENTVGVLLGNGDGSFRGPQLSAADGNIIAAAAGDFDGDGRPDLAAANGAGVSVLRNTGDWRLFLVGGLPSPTTAGDAHTVTVTALDGNGNVMTGYVGTVHFTSTDSQAGLPPDYTFTPADQATHTFSVNLKTAGWATVAVADTGSTAFGGSQSVVVNPAAASTFRMSGASSAVPAGGYDYLTVTASDAYGNAVPNYAGTVRFASSDPRAGLPADYTFTPDTDYGTASFSASLGTVGTQSITVADAADPAVRGSVTGIRVTPVATLAGSDGGLINQPLTFTLGAVSGLPAGTTFTYAIDWTGDGVTDQTVTGPDGTAVTHAYATGGWYTPLVTATVRLGGEDFASGITSQWVYVAALTVTVRADPGDPARSALVVEGSAGADSIALNPGAGNALVLSAEGRVLGTYTAPGGAAFAHLLVYGYGGNDYISLYGAVAVPALLFGGDGNDSLYVDGASLANHVLVGGAGADSLYGGGGRDLVIGGTGADTLRGGGGDDILIGGYTDYDGNVTALLAVMKEWGRADADYATRVKHLNGTLAGGLNGSYRLTATTVHDDAATDSLSGQAGTDWFFVGGTRKKQDVVGDPASGEVVTSL
jgi:FG-GAP-like repeat/RTX calcium-binding nonapeptide repeat (4 copies)